MWGWSQDAQINRATFFHQANTIDIFIEDTDQMAERLYTDLLSNVLTEHHIETVNPVNGRSGVIKAFESRNCSTNRSELYIIDGDLYLMTTHHEDVPDEIFVLPCYCIENILLSKDGVLEISCEEAPCVRRAQAADDVNYDEWFKKNKKRLTALFIEYAVVFSICPTIPTVSFELRNLKSSNSGIVCRKKIGQRIKTLRAQVMNEVGKEQYFDQKKNIIRFIKQSMLNTEHYISGKNFWLPLASTRIRTATGTRSITNQTLRSRLLKYANLELFAGINEYILN